MPVGSLICTLELSKTANEGLTVTIEDPDGSAAQTIRMDGSSIIFMVKGSSATSTSTITQTAEKVSIKCKQLEVIAEQTITMKSTEASTYESADTLTVKSAKEMTVKSQAGISASAVNIEARGDSSIKLTGGGQSNLELAAAGASLAGPKAAVKGQAEAAVSAPTVKVTADAMLSAESSGVATLKGSITNVQGALINLG